LAHVTASGQQTTKRRPFDWTNKPQLTSEQQKLLHLHKKLDNAPTDPAKRQALKEEIERLATKLGSITVRPARPGELIVSHVGQTGQASIYNPSEANLAFTVAIKGDEEWMGSRKGSIGRETYLPPKSALSVTNLYWTTSRMTDRN